MLSEERRQYILNLINKTGGAKAADLAKIFKLSEITIRRDLDKLAKKGLLKRIHGGAIGIYSSGYELNFNIDEEEYIEEKKRIGLAASALVEEDDIILLEAGAASYYTAVNIINKKNLTVVTNSCDIAGLISGTNPHFKILLSGGILKPDTRSLIGPAADVTFRSTFVNKAFISIGGIDYYKGITASDLIEAQTKRNIINSAKQVIALFDHSKIERVEMNFVASIKSVNQVITGTESGAGFIDKIREAQIEAIIV